MRVRFLWLFALALWISACTSPPAPTPFIMPTLLPMPNAEGFIDITPTPDPAIAQLPSATPTLLPTNTETPTEIPSETATELILPTNTSVPIASETPTLRPIILTSTPDITPFPERSESVYSDMSYDEAFDLLQQTPLIVMPTEHVRQIYDRGRFRGLRDDFLLSVGDCNSESGWYLESLLDDSPPDSGVDATFYDNEAIQSTISYYSDAFAFKGQSVNSGLNAASVLDPFWASADVCPFGASPLACDYQLTESFASLIMFGANDVNVLNTASYELAMREIIETTLDRDIIPILSTFTVRPLEDNTYATGVRFNGVLVRLAEEYQIPLVNFWLATRELADRGILEDNAHLTVAGFNIRNQLTVEILAQIRLDIMMNEGNS
ncbi:MAG: hypothetical protein Phog2KO_42190 [Phototrophicaceae bacterium]